MASVIQFIDMEIDFFERLSPDEADAFLQRFLEVESSNITGIAKQCATDGIKMNYTIKSIPPFMRWVLKRLTTIRLEPDPAVPAWLRNHEVYVNNLFDFDGPSGILIMRAGYYLGESFIRSYRSLHWGTGDIETVEANMPVVAGFQHQLEMAPVLIVDNILARIISNPKQVGDIERAVESWKDHV